MILSEIHEALRHLSRISLISAIGWSGCQSLSHPPTDTPVVLDPMLSIDLVASTPTIVTPIGIAIDAQDHIYVLESHTHSPASDYRGPKYDRIKIGLDGDGDGIPDEWQIFADSIVAGMNLSIDTEGILYAVTKDRVLSYQDNDEDGVSDEKKVLLKMVAPNQIYDHAGLLGITTTADGWLFISRGNTGGKRWRLEGTDGSFASGFGDGGNVMRSRKDGSEVEVVATGFWNPFDITFAADGRLLLSDNDPDSRGPNRMVEIVAGGDYGYKSLYGGSGIHPFLAWNGELPGTLPFAAPLGEAPCGMLDASYSNFGTEYQGHILATIWEEHTLVHIPLVDHGSSVRGSPEILVKGDSLFHPVAMAADSRGNVYLTDWVVRQYPNHGRGKLWRISSRQDRPNQPFEETANANLPMSVPQQDSAILSHLGSKDPFIASRARHAMASTAKEKDVLLLLDDPDKALVVAGLLLATKLGIHLNDRVIKRLLHQPFPDIQQALLMYLSDRGNLDDLPIVEQAFTQELLSPDLFECFLATVRHLQPAFVQARPIAVNRNDQRLDRNLPEGYILSIVENEALSPQIRAKALAHLKSGEEHLDLILGMLSKSIDHQLLEAVILTLKTIRHPKVGQTLVSFAANEDRDGGLRALSIIALFYQSDDFCQPISRLLNEKDHLVSYAALRYLIGCKDDPNISTSVSTFLASAPKYMSEAWSPDSAQSTIEKVKADPDLGKLVFHLPQTQCTACHRVDGWGGIFGPDLSNIGSSKNTRQLKEAILNPSAEVAPAWQGWFVTDAQSNKHYGRQIDIHLTSVELMDATGEFVTYHSPMDYGLSPASLMPDGLEKGISNTAFEGLITYLESLE